MAIFTCPGCGHTRETPVEYVGRSAWCRKCGQSFVIATVVVSETGESVTGDELEHWKEQRMQRFRQKPLEERRQEAISFFESVSQSALSRDADRVKSVSVTQWPVSDTDMEYFTALPEVERITLFEVDVT